MLVYHGTNADIKEIDLTFKINISISKSVSIHNIHSHISQSSQYAN